MIRSSRNNPGGHGHASVSAAEADDAFPASDEALAREAAEWLVELEDGGGKREEAFTDWLLADRANVHAFLRAKATDELVSAGGAGKDVHTDLSSHTPSEVTMNRSAQAARQASAVLSRQSSLWRASAEFLRDTCVNMLVFALVGAAALSVEWVVRWLELAGVSYYVALFLRGVSLLLIVMDAIAFVGMQGTLFYRSLKRKPFGVGYDSEHEYVRMTMEIAESLPSPLRDQVAQELAMTLMMKFREYRERSVAD